MHYHYVSCVIVYLQVRSWCCFGFAQIANELHEIKSHINCHIDRGPTILTARYTF